MVQASHATQSATAPPGGAHGAPSRRAALGGLLASALLFATGTSAFAAPSRRAKAATPAQVAALQRASRSVVGIETKAVTDAPSIDVMGELRRGSGVVIGADGLVLTIGYLLLDADDATLLLDDGRRLPARIVALDLATGFGLLQSLVPLEVPVAPLARRVEARRNEPLLLVSGGEDGSLSVASLTGRQPYSGFWEYHIDNALFTQPPRTDHSGAGLFNARGELLGIGSLLVLDTPGEYEQGPGNMFVPVDLLPPILPELRARGSSQASHRAWLGLSCGQEPDGVQIERVIKGSPADRAGLQPGDTIVQLDGQPVLELAAFYKRLWAGEAERKLMLQVLRDGERRDIPVRTVDRLDTLRHATVI